MSSPSAATELVLLGAGHAHVQVLRRLVARPLTSARVTLISREPHSVHAPLLAGLIRGEHDFDTAHVDLRALSRAAGARLLVATAEGLDLVGRTIRLAGRPALPFDLLSVNIGGGPASPDGSGVPARPVGQLLARLAEIEPLLGPDARLAIVGAGVGGTELALSLARRLAGQVRIALVCADAMPVMDAPAHARAAIRDALVDAGVELISGVRAGIFRDGQLELSDGSALEAVAAFWATGACAPAFLSASGLGCDADGAIQVDGGLRSITHPFVFAAGDCATRRDAPRPRSASVAMQAGNFLAGNLRRALAGKKPAAWRPSPHGPVILGLGNGQAIGWLHGLSRSGQSPWRWKQRRDHAWAKRQGLKAIVSPAPLAWSAMLPPQADTTLAGMLERLPRLSPARLPSGASVIQASAHLHCFLDDPFLFGQIVAVAALAASPTPGARPWTAIGTVAWPYRGEAGEADLAAMLHGAAGVLAGEGCALTALRAEPGDVLALGLSTTFLMDPGQAMWAADIRPGDALILTKPLGAGIVLEADRRGLARARWLHAALAAMRRSNGKAAAVLRGHGALCWAGIGARGLGGAMTGLLAPAGLTALLASDSVPALPGARDLAAIGVVAPGSAGAEAAFADCDPVTAALLVDPNPCGGLLAALPATYAQTCLFALRQAGHAASIIGSTQAAAPGREGPEAIDTTLVVAGQG